MLLSVYTLVILLSTALATPTPSYDFKQVSRAEVVRRVERGMRARAPVPSTAGGAPDPITVTGTTYQYGRFYTGSGMILRSNPSGEFGQYPSRYATYPNTVSTASALQQCVDTAFLTDGNYIGVALWFDESDDLWHCRYTFDRNDAADFTAVDANARPVYGYNLI